MKLNLGSFNSKIEGFLNVDLQDLPGVDIRCDISKLPMEENTVDEILASHCLEHFSHMDTEEVLKGWLKVLKPGGKLFVAVPDMPVICDFVCRYGWGKWLERITYGDQDYHWGRHQSGFDYEWLKFRLTNSGYTDIQRVDTFDFVKDGAIFVRLPDMLDGESKAMSLNVIAVKPVEVR